MLISYNERRSFVSITWNAGIHFRFFHISKEQLTHCPILRDWTECCSCHKSTNRNSEKALFLNTCVDTCVQHHVQCRSWVTTFLSDVSSVVCTVRCADISWWDFVTDKDVDRKSRNGSLTTHHPYPSVCQLVVDTQCDSTSCQWLMPSHHVSVDKDWHQSRHPMWHLPNLSEGCVL